MKRALAGAAGAIVAGLTITAALAPDVAAGAALGLAVGLAGGFALGVRYTMQAARRARAQHLAEENRRRTMQEQELAGMSRTDRRRAAQAAAREIARQGGRSKRGRA